jgi:acetylornithine deacetylase/succinyl-diaminopimelate desuccinylase-like protein
MYTTPTDRPTLYKYLDANFFAFISQLADFISIQSISAEQKHRDDIIKCAKWLAAHLQKIGLEHVNIIPTEKHPIVYADWLHAHDKPTLLIYGHYDVQPVDPLNEWKDDPFSGRIKNGSIYGRGTADDKGQLFIHVKALEYYLRNENRLPINIKCIFEGAEEIGSPGLDVFLRENAIALRSDVAVVSDTKIPSVTQPAITYSLRGMLGLELEVNGQKQDLHSGTFGGTIYNPLQVLCEMIAAMHDKNGRITIPGFYNSVQEVGPSQRNYMRNVGQPDMTIAKDAGATTLWGEKEYSAYERTTIRPSLSINGIKGGYQGDGPKAIIPSKASAKISFRLVPAQEPMMIEKLFREYIMSIKPEGINCNIRKVASAKPVIVNLDNPYIRAASSAYKNAFNNETIFLASGGTIPIVNLLQESLKIPTVLMGFALPTDNLHGPNEHFSLSNFYKGILTSLNFMHELSKIR